MPSSAKTFAFGSGSMICLSNGKPIKVGSLQNIELDMSRDIKMLYGQNEYPDAIAAGQSKLTGKAKSGIIDLGLLNAIYYGKTLDTTGYEKLLEGEAKTIPASSPYTVTAANATTFTGDMGVYYAASGAPLQQVAAGSEAAGKYSVNTATGVYTFAAADANAGVSISYTFNSTSGSQLLITNQPTGSNPVFQLFLQEGFNGTGGRTNASIRLYACVASKTTFPFKNDDFAVQDLEFSCFADANGNVWKPGIGQ